MLEILKLSIQAEKYSLNQLKSHLRKKKSAESTSMASFDAASSLSKITSLIVATDRKVSLTDNNDPPKWQRGRLALGGSPSVTEGGSASPEARGSRLKAGTGPQANELGAQAQISSCFVLQPATKYFGNERPVLNVYIFANNILIYKSSNISWTVIILEFRYCLRIYHVSCENALIKHYCLNKLGIIQNFDLGHPVWVCFFHICGLSFHVLFISVSSLESLGFSVCLWMQWETTVFFYAVFQPYIKLALYLQPLTSRVFTSWLFSETYLNSTLLKV